MKSMDVLQHTMFFLAVSFGQVCGGYWNHQWRISTSLNVSLVKHPISTRKKIALKVSSQKKQKATTPKGCFFLFSGSWQFYFLNTLSPNKKSSLNFLIGLYMYRKFLEALVKSLVWKFYFILFHFSTKNPTKFQQKNPLVHFFRSFSNTKKQPTSRHTGPDRWFNLDHPIGPCFFLVAEDRL